MVYYLTFDYRRRVSQTRAETRSVFSFHDPYTSEAVSSFKFNYPVDISVGDCTVDRAKT